MVYPLPTAGPSEPTAKIAHTSTTPPFDPPPQLLRWAEGNLARAEAPPQPPPDPPTKTPHTSTHTSTTPTFEPPPELLQWANQNIPRAEPPPQRPPVPPAETAPPGLEQAAYDLLRLRYSRVRIWMDWEAHEKKRNEDWALYREQQKRYEVGVQAWRENVGR